MSPADIVEKKQSKSAASVSSKPQRILSIDALRGFDMFWIIGGAYLFPDLDKIFHHPITAWLTAQSEHSAWDQPHLLDLIFPLFLFIVGLVLPVAIDRRKAEGVPLWKLHLHTLKRALVLVLLGMLAKGLLLNFTVKVSVLSRIGFAYYVAALLVMHTTWRFQAVLTAAMLAAAAVAMTLIPIAALNGSAYINKDIASVMPVTAEAVRWLLSVPSVLFGVLAGHYLRSSHTGNRKTSNLALAGLACIIVSLLAQPFIPRIFFLWTSSFVVYTAGVSLVLFAIFYWIIDVKGFSRWSFFFTVIGMNAVLIYFLNISSIIDFSKASKFFLLGISGHCGDFSSLIITTGTLAVEWLFLYFLYKHKLFFKA